MKNNFIADVVVANFYRDISDGLLSSCREALAANGCETRKVYTVPGALEIPPLLLHLARQETPPDLMAALGCVIRGETFHFEVVAQASAAGVLHAQMQTGIPVGNGVLTVENKEQAKARLNKGADAANAALALAKIYRQV